MSSVIMLSMGLYDQINKAPNTASHSHLFMTSVTYYYQMGNVIDMKLSQSDNIKQLTLYIHTVGAA
jgi:hypothetical protein